LGAGPRRRWSLYWASVETGEFLPPVVGAFSDGVGVFEGRDHLDGRPLVGGRSLEDRAAEPPGTVPPSPASVAGNAWSGGRGTLPAPGSGRIQGGEPA
jgi:hypothetical protein